MSSFVRTFPLFPYLPFPKLSHPTGKATIRRADRRFSSPETLTK
jgi:hypothetical protein